jgi:hypothetical protein
MASRIHGTKRLRRGLRLSLLKPLLENNHASIQRLDHILIMKDWAVSFIAAVLIVGLVIWCAYVVIPLLR